MWSKIFNDLTRHPKFFEPARQIRGRNLYIQQTKINVKAAFTGEVWQWHYDFATHSGEDGAPKPLALNLHVFWFVELLGVSFDFLGLTYCIV